MRHRVRKPATTLAVKKCVSAPATLFEWGDAQRRVDGFATFSDYIQHLIRSDKDRRAANRVAA